MANEAYYVFMLISILMQIWIMIGMVIMETEGGAEVGERDLFFMLILWLLAKCTACFCQ